MEGGRITSLIINLGFISFDFVWTPYRESRLREVVGKFKPFNHYVGQINQYYARYPEDECIGVFVLLEEFSDQKNRTPEEIDKLYSCTPSP